jgi:hypothetical protein
MTPMPINLHVRIASLLTQMTKPISQPNARPCEGKYPRTSQ